MKCTSDFLTWINSLDRSVRIRIDARLLRLLGGNPGQHRRFDSLLELKLSGGTMGSFRIYLVEHNGIVIILGGHKDSQTRDIERAKVLLEGVTSGKAKLKNYG